MEVLTPLSDRTPSTRCSSPDLAHASGKQILGMCQRTLKRLISPSNRPCGWVSVHHRHILDPRRTQNRVPQLFLLSYWPGSQKMRCTGEWSSLLEDLGGREFFNVND